MDIWLTADSHLDHGNIIVYENRPFEDKFQMTEALIENWNSVVKPNDLIFHLGDLFFSKAKRAEELAKRMNGRKILIQGNHDHYSKSKYKNVLGFDVYQHYFFDDLLFSHHPQHEIPLRVAINSGLLKGNVHGHVHSEIEGLDQSIYKCVSVELTDYKPIHIEEVKAHFGGVLV